MVKKFYHIAPPLRRQNPPEADFAFISFSMDELSNKPTPEVVLLKFFSFCGIIIVVS